MRTLLHLSLSAFILGFIMLCPALAQTAPPTREQPKNEEAELKALQERLRKLIEEMRAKEARKNEAPKAEPTKPAPPAPALDRPANPYVPADPTIAALEKLSKSPDPRVATLAKELLAAMPRAAAPRAGTFFLEWDGSQQGGKPGGGLEFRIEPPPHATKPKPGAPIELKIEDLKFDFKPGAEGIKGQPHIVVVGDVKAGGAASGVSSLKMSADGKTAAVVGADGGIVIYDVASGKEQMRFPAKR